MERWSVFSDFRREPIVGVLTSSPSKQVVRQLNERPRKALGIETPAERFNASVASTG
jgi:IS30 family transposase